MSLVTGCQPRFQPSVVYSDAQQKLGRGLFDAALQTADRGYRGSDRSDTLWAWKFKLLKAEAYLRQGNLHQAEELLGEEPPWDLSVEILTRRRILRAEAVCRLGRSEEAKAVFHQAEQLIPPERRDLRAAMALAQGRCALSGDGSMAKEYFLSAAELARGNDSLVEATALVNIGFVLVQGQDYDQAIPRFNEALSITDSPYLREKALGNLGFSYSQLGELRRAIPFSNQAEDLAVKINNNRDQVKWLIDIGREHFAQLEYAAAEASFKKALSIAENLRDGNDTAICLHNLAQLALRTGDASHAEAYIRREESLNPHGARFVELLLDRAQQAKSLGNLPVAESYLMQMQDQNTDSLLRWKVQSELALVYAAEQKVDLADVMFRRAVTTADTGRSRTAAVEYKISFLDKAPFYDQYVKFLATRNRILEALDIAERGRSPTLSDVVASGTRKSIRGATLHRIQQELRARRSVVLAYWLGWEESYLWVITPSQFKLLHLPPELEIEKELETYSREVSVPDGPEKSHTGEKLYEVLLRPAATLIPKGWSAIIVPHRKLYNLNFETLVVPGDKPHYWIEDVASHNVNFLSALTNSRQQASGYSGKKLLLIGAPVFVDKQYSVLKQAPAEMKQVASHFPTAEKTVIDGKDATPGAYLASRPDQFRFIHFVTHGTTSTVLENPLDSAIILSPDGNSASGDPQSAYHLYGKQIMDKPLHADLVTISACYGLGREYSGEGMVGLAWAFMRAGAHQVVAALWEVDDAATLQLMDTFYDELTQGKPAAEALRDAKLKLLRSNDFHRPYYWASLQLYSGS